MGQEVKTKIKEFIAGIIDGTIQVEGGGSDGKTFFTEKSTKMDLSDVEGFAAECLNQEIVPPDISWESLVSACRDVIKEIAKKDG